MSWSKTVKKASRGIMSNKIMRPCIYCNEAMEHDVGILTINREPGYGLVGLAHETCAAGRLQTIGS